MTRHPPEPKGIQSTTVPKQPSVATGFTPKGPGVVVFSPQRSAATAQDGVARLSLGGSRLASSSLQEGSRSSLGRIASTPVHAFGSGTDRECVPRSFPGGVVPGPAQTVRPKSRPGSVEVRPRRNGTGSPTRRSSEVKPVAPGPSQEVPFDCRPKSPRRTGTGSPRRRQQEVVPKAPPVGSGVVQTSPQGPAVSSFKERILKRMNSPTRTAARSAQEITPEKKPNAVASSTQEMTPEKLPRGNDTSTTPPKEAWQPASGTGADSAASIVGIARPILMEACQEAPMASSSSRIPVPKGTSPTGTASVRQGGSARRSASSRKTPRAKSETAQRSGSPASHVHAQIADHLIASHLHAQRSEPDASNLRAQIADLEKQLTFERAFSKEVGDENSGLRKKQHEIEQARDDAVDFALKLERDIAELESRAQLGIQSVGIHTAAAMELRAQLEQDGVSFSTQLIALEKQLEEDEKKLAVKGELVKSWQEEAMTAYAQLERQRQESQELSLKLATQVSELQKQVESQEETTQKYQEEASLLRAQLEENSGDVYSQLAELESLITDISTDGDMSMDSTGCSVGGSRPHEPAGKLTPDKVSSIVNGILRRRPGGAAPLGGVASTMKLPSCVLNMMDHSI